MDQNYYYYIIIIIILFNHRITLTRHIVTMFMKTSCPWYISWYISMWTLGYLAFKQLVYQGHFVCMNIVPTYII